MATYNISVYLNDKEALVYLKDKAKYDTLARETVKKAVTQVSVTSETKKDVMSDKEHQDLVSEARELL